MTRSTPSRPRQAALSVIIVPRSTETKPLPSLELLRRVQAYLVTNGIPLVNVAVVVPLYVSVNITAEVAGRIHWKAPAK